MMTLLQWCSKLIYKFCLAIAKMQSLSVIIVWRMKMSTAKQRERELQNYSKFSVMLLLV